MAWMMKKTDVVNPAGFHDFSVNGKWVNS